MKQDGKFFYGWIVLGATLIVVMLTIPIINALSSLYTVPITEEMNISRSQFSVTGMIVSIMTVIMSPVAGKIYNSHRFKARTVQCTALIVMALGYGAFVLAHSPWQLYIASFFIGLGFITAGMLPTSMIINNWFEKGKGMAMSIAMIGISAGSMILSPIMNNIILEFGWRTCRIVIMLAIIFIALPLAWFVIKENPSDVGQRPFGSGESERELKKKDKKVPKVENNIPLRYALKSPFFYILCIGIMCNGFLAGGAISQYTPFFTDNFDSTTAAWLLSLGSLMGIIGKLIAGGIFDKLGNTASILIVTISGMLVFILYVLWPENLTVMISTTFFDGIGTSLQSLGVNLLIPAIFGTCNYAEIFGSMKMTQQFGIATGGVVIALIFDITGSYSLAWAACTAMMAVSGIAIIYADKKSAKLNGIVQQQIALENKKEA